MVCTKMMHAYSHQVKPKWSKIKTNDTGYFITIDCPCRPGGAAGGLPRCIAVMLNVVTFANELCTRMIDIQPEYGRTYTGKS